MAKARVTLDTNRQILLSVDPEKTRSALAPGSTHDHCAVCGPECAAQVAAKYYGI
ncbi:phosphomethylpyrimidine synthase ThiC [Paradesulfitobacterium aromaticivorans]